MKTRLATDIYEIRENAATGVPIAGRYSYELDTAAWRALAARVASALDARGHGDAETWWDAEWSVDAVLARERGSRHYAYVDDVDGDADDATKASAADENARLTAARARVIAFERFQACAAQLVREDIPIDAGDDQRLLLAQRILFVHRLVTDREYVHDGEPFIGVDVAKGERRWGSRAWAGVAIARFVGEPWTTLVQKAMAIVEPVALQTTRPETEGPPTLANPLRPGRDSTHTERERAWEATEQRLLKLFDSDTKWLGSSRRAIARELDMSPSTLKRRMDRASDSGLRAIVSEWEKQHALRSSRVARASDESDPSIS